ncbi:MAG: hypothetical protein IPH85_07725 [Ignavibacteria bacterium]|nr:hypothetical protein [Ignavibacteria bacterium]MBK7185804.1 hypothetical protein [Ignavibacteria bacterium]MBK7577633.1 hypothetical protein [Ignavibacteria bacterium]MBK9184443.1 hypothetical protein [Ignavibacteria bacterium]
MSSAYLTALRWESRSVIAFISIGIISLSVAALISRDVMWIVTACLVILGTVLAFWLRRTIREDYLHIDGYMVMLYALPPFSFSVIFAGMIQTWMNRVGFGTTMRVAVVSILGTIIPSALFGFEPTTSAIVCVVAVSTSLLREFRPSGEYMAPVGLAIFIRSILQW